MNSKKRIAITLLLSAVVLVPIITIILKTANLPAIAEETPSVTIPSLKSLDSLELMVQKNPSFDHLINLSMAYIHNKMPSKSILHLEKAIQLNPTSAIAYNNLGVAYIMLEQFGEGELACAKALQLDPTFQLAKNNLTWANDEITKINNLISVKEQESIAQRGIEFYNELGLLYFKLSDYDTSIELWNKVFEYDSKNVAAMNSIGIAFMKKNKVNEAIHLLKKALEIEPNNQLVKNNLAWALDVQSKRKE